MSSKSLRTTLVVFALSLTGACNVIDVNPETTSASGEVVQESSEPVVLSFDRWWPAVKPPRPLSVGDLVRIDFDTQRFYDGIKGSNTSFGWFASAHHCYGYGCCEVAFSEIAVHSRFRFDEAFLSTTVDMDIEDGSGIKARRFTIDLVVPEGAQALELWFSTPGYHLHSWYCGCDVLCQKENYERGMIQFHEYKAFDSVYGRNYVVPVAQ